MAKRIAKVAQEYAQRHIEVGETFDVDESDVALLLELGRLEPDAPQQGYATRDMTAGRSRGYRTKRTAQ
jgi:hypothetical protein